MENPDPRKMIAEGLEYERSGALDKALVRYRAALEASDDPSVVADALRRQSHVHRTRSEWEPALRTARESAVHARDSGSRHQLAEALNAEAAVYQSRGDFADAVPLFERVLTLSDDDRARGVALQNLGAIAAQTGDREAAEQRFIESYECFQRAGYLWGQAFALTNRAAIALDVEDYERARVLAIEAAGKAREVEDLDLLAVADLNRAEAIAALGDYERAEEVASAALGYFSLTGNSWRRAYCLRMLGDFAREQGHAATARRYYETGLQLAEEIGMESEASEARARLDAMNESRA